MIKILMFLVLLSAQNVFGEVISTKEEPLSLNNFEKSWVIMLDVQRSSTTTIHQEYADVSGFTPLGEAIEINKNTIGLILLKEFYRHNFMSFSASIGGGILNGSEEGQGFNQKLSGTHGSVGVSANLNYFAWSMKIQPFLGFNYSGEQAKYQLTYSDINNTKYNYVGQQGAAQLGVRFLDGQMGMMSYLSLGYIAYRDANVDAYATLDKREVLLSDSELRPTDVFLSLGFGVLF